MSPPLFTMPSVLSIPTAEIPFHFLHFPITQCETLLAHVLTHPHLSQALVDTAVIQGNPVLQQLFPLYCSYVIISFPPTSLSLWYPLRSWRHLMPACPQPTQPSLSCWWTRDSMELLSSSLTMNSSPYSAPSSPSLKSNSRPTTRNRWRLRWQLQKELSQLREPMEQGPPPHYHLPRPTVDPCSPHPARESSPADSLTSYSSMETHIAVPQIACQFHPFSILPHPDSGISTQECYR